MSTASTETVDTEVPAKQKEYGFSVLVTGFARMWRGFVPGALAVLLNATIQAALVREDPVIGEGGFEVYLLAILSGVALLLTSAILTATALESVRGRAGIKDVTSRTLSNIAGYTVWSVGLWAVAMIGFLLFTIPGIIILALTPFVTVAAMDGQGNALAANLKAISARPIRWAITIIVVGAIAAILWLLSAVNAFFITGVVASFAAVLVIGFVVWWLQTSWACLYRSTPVGTTDGPEQDAV
jgi:hypothetical protein